MPDEFNKPLYFNNVILDIKRTEATGNEPVTLAEAKTHINTLSSDDNTYITALITQCRRRIESYCNISIKPKLILLTAEIVSEIELPYGPVTTITSVKTIDSITASGAVTYTTDSNHWSLSGEYYKLFSPAAGSSGNRYQITYSTGYTVSEIPLDLTLAVLAEISYRYARRGDLYPPSLYARLNSEAESLALKYRRLWI